MKLSGIIFSLVELATPTHNAFPLTVMTENAKAIAVEHHVPRMNSVILVSLACQIEINSLS
jgi:hypothetical protein